MAKVQRVTKRPPPPPVVWKLELSDEEAAALCNAMDVYVSVRRGPRFHSPILTKRLEVLRELRKVIGNAALTNIEEDSE
jgi:hypothetical protein